MNKVTPTPLVDQDTLPWYRQFWPWFLILLPASVVVAGLSTVYIANRYADDLVVDDYYKNGLAINRQLDKKDVAEALGLTADFSFTNVSVTVAMTGAIGGEQLELQLSHPLEADRDFTVMLEPDGSGHYHGLLPTPVAARWHWILLSEAGGWRLDGAVVDGDIEHASHR